MGSNNFIRESRKNDSISWFLSKISYIVSIFGAPLNLARRAYLPPSLRHLYEDDISIPVSTNVVSISVDWRKYQFLQHKGGGWSENCTTIEMRAVVRCWWRKSVHRRIFIKKCCLSMKKEFCHVRRLGIV